MLVGILIKLFINSINVLCIWVIVSSSNIKCIQYVLKRSLLENLALNVPSCNFINFSFNCFTLLYFLILFISSKRSAHQETLCLSIRYPLFKFLVHLAIFNTYSSWSLRALYPPSIAITTLNFRSKSRTMPEFWSLLF